MVLIRKAYDRERRARKRQWKLRRLVDQVETASAEQEFMVRETFFGQFPLEIAKPGAASELYLEKNLNSHFVE